MHPSSAAAMNDLLRVAFAPLLVCASLLALVDCASGEASLGKRRPGAEDEIQTRHATSTADATTPSPRPDPVLAFAFDGNRSLRARVRTEVSQGASLFVSIFASNDGEDPTIDCDSMRRAQPVDLTRAGPAGAVVVADVPADPSLLGRLDGNLRTTIQGCLFDGRGQVAARVSTSLMNAWDTDGAVASKTPRILHGVEAYSNTCIEEIGDLPMFAGGDFDCLRDPGMAIVPITATRDDGRVTTIGSPSDWPLDADQRDATAVCDRPAWLGYGTGTPCAPFTRVGRYTNAQGTDFVVICRRTTVTDPMDPNFDVMGVIAQNPRSGKTCWFNKRPGVTDMSRIPSPNTPTANWFWMDSAGIRDEACPTCHDSDPWLHSPWIDQGVDARGRPRVPRIGTDSDYTVATKYAIVARESFTIGGVTSADDWKQPQHLGDVGTCSSCHRIGAGATAFVWAARSVGDPSDRDFQDVFLTNAFRSIEKLHWMPTSTFTTADQASMQRILTCASAPQSCPLVDVPQ
jgi:hypothetical protein